MASKTNRKQRSGISYRKLLEFDWPRKMSSFKPRQQKLYRHEVAVIAKEQIDCAYVLYFTNEKNARAFKHAAEQAVNHVIVAYKRTEIPHITDGGFINY